jgi:hypothetical protein
MRRKLASGGLGVVVVLGAFASGASADMGAPGKFSCRGSAVRAGAPALSAEPEVANPAGSPCLSDSRQAANVFIGTLFSAGLVTAQTNSNPGGVAGGQAKSSNANPTIKVGTTTITAQGLSAQAKSGCDTGTKKPAVTSSSNVVGLVINGQPPITTSAPMTITVDPVVTVYLNRTVSGPGTTVTQRALEVSAPPLTTDVVAAEATADVESCETNIFDNRTPGTPVAVDPNPVELGVKFHSDVAGLIRGVRFYEGLVNGTTHTGSLWSKSGTLLATATFPAETAVGWQEVRFSSPVSITAGTTYVASYHTASGHYAADHGFFATSGFDNPPLHAHQSLPGDPDGVFVYGLGGVFPSNGCTPSQPCFASNYWADVIFSTS